MKLGFMFVWCSSKIYTPITVKNKNLSKEQLGKKNKMCPSHAAYFGMDPANVIMSVCVDVNCQDGRKAKENHCFYKKI